MISTHEREENTFGPPSKWDRVRARLRELWIALVNPVTPWHRLNDRLLRDIGKTAVDAEREAYCRRFGSSPDVLPGERMICICQANREIEPPPQDQFFVSPDSIYPPKDEADRGEGGRG